MKIPVLIYHDVLPDRQIGSLDKRQRFYTLSLGNFQKHVAHVASRGFRTITTNTLQQGAGSKQPAVFLTFDDGLASSDRCARILHEKGMTAAFFIVTDFVGRQGYLTWPQIKAMAEMGMDIQSHTCSHPIMTELSEDRLVDELARSKQVIETLLGKQVKAVSIPQGFENQKILQTAREQGYQYIFTSRPGLFDPSRPGPICRLSIYNRTSPAVFRRLAQQNRLEIFKQQASKHLLAIPKALLGDRNYHLLRTRLMRVLKG